MAHIELGLEEATKEARPLPGQVPSVLPSANVIDTSTGLMWQAQLALNAVISSSGYGYCPEKEDFVCSKYQYPGLTALHGATPWKMSDVSRFVYYPAEGINPDRWVAEEWSGGVEGFVDARATVGDDAPAKLAFGDWKAAPQKALEGLIAGTSYPKMVEAGFSPKLFVVEEFAIKEPGIVIGGGSGRSTEVEDVLTLPGNGASSEFAFPNWAGFFNFNKGDVGVGLYEANGRLNEISANYLMERTPAASECWYYASPEQHASCP